MRTAAPRGSGDDRRNDRRQATQRPVRTAKTDAIALLKADHRQVAAWFKQYEHTRATDRKQALATKICNALKIHTEIEEEIFYPAFLDCTADSDLHHEAIVEHAGAKRLIAEIEASNPTDDYFDAKVTVLSEMIKHHVKEEEQPGGMFAEARKSGMDMLQVGQELKARKMQLQG